MMAGSITYVHLRVNSTTGCTFGRPLSDKLLCPPPANLRIVLQWARLTVMTKVY